MHYPDEQYTISAKFKQNDLSMSDVQAICQKYSNIYNVISELSPIFV